MAHLLDLPAELRQQILLLALPGTIKLAATDVSPLVNYLLVCRKIKQDLTQIGIQYAPEYIITEPAHFIYLKHGPAVGRYTHLTLQIFAPASLSSLLDQQFSAVLINDIEKLLTRWSKALLVRVTPLPKIGLKTVNIDVTAIPGYARDRNRNWIAWLVNDSAVSNKMWNHYEHQVATIIDFIGTWFQITAQQQQPTLRLSGAISPKSKDRMPTVLRSMRRLKNEEGINTIIDLDWLDDPDLLQWEAVLELLQREYERTPAGPLRKSRFEVKQCLRHTFERNRRFRSLFNKNVLEDPDWSEKALMDVAALAVSHPGQQNSLTQNTAKSITYEYVESIKRAFLHQLAQALGLRSESTDERMSAGITYKRLVVEKSFDDGTGDGDEWNRGLEEDPDAAKELALVQDIA
jgi:hypothetical protein